MVAWGRGGDGRAERGGEFSSRPTGRAAQPVSCGFGTGGLPTMKIAFLGTGLMGSGFVRRLRTNGHEVNVWNRSAAKARALEADGATGLRRSGRGGRGRRAHPPVAVRRCLGRRRARAAGGGDPGRHLDRRPHHHGRTAHRRARRALECARPRLRPRAGLHGPGQRARGHRPDARLGRASRATTRCCPRCSR